MLQIIGWLGCLYLLVKGLELIARPRDSENRQYATFGAVLAILGAFVFAYLIYVQGRASENAFQGIGGGYTGAVPDYVGANVNDAATDDAANAADNALSDADNAIRNAQQAIEASQQAVQNAQ